MIPPAPPAGAAIVIRQMETLDAAVFAKVLRASGLAQRRPVDDAGRLARMVRHANLIVVAQDTATGGIVGVARALTDFAYCCYLSDLAVDRAYQGRGIGTGLIARTREIAGREAMCLLLS